MALGRVRWGCSYKKTTLVVCSINIFIALYVLRYLYSSLYIYSGNVSRNSKSLFFFFFQFRFQFFELLFGFWNIHLVVWVILWKTQFQFSICSMLVWYKNRLFGDSVRNPVPIFAYVQCWFNRKIKFFGIPTW